MTKKIIAIVLGVIMILSGINHVAQPGFYVPMIPGFINPALANWLAAITEIIVGVMLILPKYRSLGGLGFCGMMVAFLPIHVWDMLKDNPAIGSKTVAVVRLAIQFLLIYAGYWIYKSGK